MNGVLTSVVAISGTLAGSTLTYLLGLLNSSGSSTPPSSRSGPCIGHRISPP
ncbi:hypothetical protein [Amycolatopsis oliviviridis]|uniref:hypothetical protein n=1 Tax=Amycolatopsis oliviviridis TaxID=1471590 RepID=UPI001E2A0AAF|nr:hypothetical protein [Amycolatopsis oliviviridis]